jgi:hypothetical protein
MVSHAVLIVSPPSDSTPVTGMLLVPKSHEGGAHYESLEQLDLHHAMHLLPTLVPENETALLSQG